jgi:H+/Cl- antiporter ClcA
MSDGWQREQQQKLLQPKTSSLGRADGGASVTRPTGGSATSRSTGGSAAARSTGGPRAAAVLGSRSATMVGDLLDSDFTSPERSVPNWLIEEQKHHVRQPENQPKAHGKAVARRTDAEKPSSSPPLAFVKKSDSVDDYIMVDLLDAAHIPASTALANSEMAKTAAELPASDLMSTSTDSILSLPPMAGATRWHTLRAQAQEARLQSRRSSFGSRPPVRNQGLPEEHCPAHRDQSGATGQADHQFSDSVSRLSLDHKSPGEIRVLLAEPTAVDPSSSKLAGVANSQEVLSPRTEMIPLTLNSVIAGLTALENMPPIPSPRQVPGTNESDTLSSVRGTSDSLPMAKPFDDHRACRRQHSLDLEASEMDENTLGRSRFDIAGPSSFRSSALGTGKDRNRISDQQENVAGSQRSISRGSDEFREFGSTRGRPPRGKRKGRPAIRDSVYPHMWEWKRPADEDAVIPGRAWLYLALIGAASFAIAWIVNILSLILSRYVIGGIAILISNSHGARAETCFVACARALSLVLSFLTVWKLAPRYGAGSGIPEMKCVLSGVYMPNALSPETLGAKVIGLVFSLASGISIGRLGPFIHISGICATLVSRMPIFPVLSASARFQLQALSCAMAAGVGATFGAPIGGAMLSIELMSTYYYIHWLPLALYCSIMGYYCISVFVPADAQAYFVASVSVGMDDQSVYKLITYAFLGVLCGVTGALLVQYTIAMFEIRRRYMTFDTPIRSCVVLALFAAFHSIVLGQFGGVLQFEGREGILHLFNDLKVPIPAKVVRNLSPFSDSRLNAAVFLLLASATKFVLTGISLILPVPAGTFMPIFQIGALLGRCVGEVFASFDMVTWIDPRACAIVGAAGVASGTLHTVSIAIVMLEVTREAVDILPLALGVIVSYGVSKHLCSDLFSELIKVRRLPFILGLRERYPKENKLFYDRVAKVSAGQFMKKSFPYVTRQSTAGEVRSMLSSSSSDSLWGTCAFLSGSSDLRLWGTVSRSVLAEAVNLAHGSNSSANLSNPLLVSRSVEGERRIAKRSFSRSRPSELMSLGTEGNAEYGTFGEVDQTLADSDTIPLLWEYNPKVGHRLVDMAPFSVSSQTPFWKVATYFRMLGLSSMYVMDDGRTVGHLTKSQFIKHTFKVEDEARLERAREWRQERELAELQALNQSMSTGSVRSTGTGSGRMASRFSQQDLQQLSTQHQRNVDKSGRMPRWTSRK